jgi:repressor LexA
MQGLTKRQAQTLDFIRQSIEERGYPPTLREIGEFMGIRSTNGVNDHLRALERKGYLRREDMKSRALRLVRDYVTPASDGSNSAGQDLTPLGHHQDSFAHGDSPAQGASGVQARPNNSQGVGAQGVGAQGVGAQGNGAHRAGFAGAGTPAGELGLGGDDDNVVPIHVLGRVAAGLPLLAEQNVIDTVRVDRMLVRGGREVFGLRVQGDSMIDAGILNGDYIFVRKQSTAERGQIVVALIGEEATVKYYYPERDYIRFQPANSEMAPILVRATDFKPTMLLGVVVGVYRRL